MRWRHLGRGYGALDLGAVELVLWWGGGEPTRALWRFPASGEVAGWADVGEA